MEKHYLLSESDREKINRLIRKNKRTGGTTQHEEPRDYSQTPEVYIGLTEGTITGLDELPESSTGPGSGDEPGAGSCTIYRILPYSNGDSTPVLKYAGFSKSVYNLSPTTITVSSWVLLTKDKFGSWVIVDALNADPCRGFPKTLDAIDSWVTSSVQILGHDADGCLIWNSVEECESAADGITVGDTPISGATDEDLLYNNAGVLGSISLASLLNGITLDGGDFV